MVTYKQISKERPAYYSAVQENGNKEREEGATEKRIVLKGKGVKGRKEGTKVEWMKKRKKHK